MVAESTKVVPLTCHGHSRPVTHLSFSSVMDDEQYYIISACKDNNPMLRDGITGDWIGTFIGHKGAVWQARLSADAALAATGSADFSAKVWDTHTGEALYTLQHHHIVRAVAFPNQPQPKILATGGQEKKLRIFDLSQSGTSSDPSSPTNSNGAATTSQSNTSEPPSYEIGPGVHEGTIKSIVWCKNPNMIVTAADDKKIRWWDLRTRSAIAEHAVDGLIGSCELNLPASTSCTTATSSTSDPSTSSSGGPNGAGSSTLLGGTSGVLSVAAGKSAYFFDGETPGTLLKSVSMSHEVASVALHTEKRRFVVGSANDTWVRVYDYDEETELEMGKGHHGPIWSVSFSPDGKLYATGSEDGTVKLWKNTQKPYGLWR